MRLLVVEDDRDLNRQVATALEAAGYAVDKAFDGEEGWFLGDTEPYDAIILDNALPKGHPGPGALDAGGGRGPVGGAPIRLPSHEYRLLSYLMHHAGRIVSRGEIVDHLYEQDFDRDSNTIEVFVGRLRKKLGVDIIQTARGLGYVVETEGESGAAAVAKRRGVR